MRLDRRTLLGRVLSLLGGLCAGLIGGHTKAKAEAPPRGEFITLDTGIRMSEAEAARFAAEYNAELVRDTISPPISAEVPLDTSGETMPRFVDWGSETAIYRDGRVELFRVEGDRHKPPIECKKPRYKLVDGATGERVSTITGHRIMWADIDLGIYAHSRPINDRESHRGGNRLRRIALVHRPGIRFGLQRPEDMDSGFPLSRAEIRPGRRSSACPTAIWRRGGPPRMRHGGMGHKEW